MRHCIVLPASQYGHAVTRGTQGSLHILNQLTVKLKALCFAAWELEHQPARGEAACALSLPGSCAAGREAALAPSLQATGRISGTAECLPAAEHAALPAPRSQVSICKAKRPCSMIASGLSHCPGPILGDVHSAPVPIGMSNVLAPLNSDWYYSAMTTPGDSRRVHARRNEHQLLPPNDITLEHTWGEAPAGGDNQAQGPAWQRPRPSAAHALRAPTPAPPPPHSLQSLQSSGDR